jgi:hypothetical protein
LLAGLGSVVASISEDYRDFSFDVHGSATGTNSVAELGYLDSYTATITSASGVVQFTSPTMGTGGGSGVARIVGHDNFESYSYLQNGAASGSVNNGVLSDISVAQLPASVPVTGSFNPSTWAVQTQWNGRMESMLIVGSFNGSLSQSLPNTDFVASATFDTTAAEAIHDASHSVNEIADAVRATVTIDVLGQHMKAATMGSTVTTAEIYLGPPSENRPLVEPIPIHWNTGQIVVELSHFLTGENSDGALHVVFDSDNSVTESDESNNDIAFPIPYDIATTGMGWLPNGSVLGTFQIAAAGLNNTVLPSTRASIYFADAANQRLDAFPDSPLVIDPLSDRSISGLSRADSDDGQFAIGTLPLTWRPDGATQLLLGVDQLIIPQNTEIDETNNVMVLPLTEMSRTTLAFTPQETLQVVIGIEHMPLIRETTAELYWATGNASDYTLLNRIKELPLPISSIGEVAFEFSLESLGVPPLTTTAVVLVIDPIQEGFPMGLILEPDENNAFFTERLDFGDASSDYPVSLAADGARHVIGPLFLGETITPESNSAGSAFANSDRGDDGVVPDSSLAVSAFDPQLASFQVTASQAGKLDAWIDFNQDGDWADSGENIYHSVEVHAGVNVLPFTIPVGALPGNSHARFRLSQDGGLSPTGRAADGEVEDYSFSFSTLVIIEVKYSFNNETITITNNGDATNLTSGANLLLSHPSAEIGSIELTGDATDQTVSIDFGSGFVVPANGLRISGGGGTNTLTVIGDGSRLDLVDPNVEISDFANLVMPETSSAAVILNAEAIQRLSPIQKNLRIMGGPATQIEVSNPTQWRIGDLLMDSGRYFVTATHMLNSNETIQADLSRYWNNFVRPSDVNNDGFVSALDALIIINELNFGRYSSPATAALLEPAQVSVWPGLYFDQNGDQHVTALDALRVINQMPGPDVQSATGELLASVATEDVPQPLWLTTSGPTVATPKPFENVGLFENVGPIENAELLRHSVTKIHEATVPANFRTHHLMMRHERSQQLDVDAVDRLLSSTLPDTLLDSEYEDSF